MTSTEIAAASKIMLGTTEAVAMYIGSTLMWQTGGGQHSYSQDYFTIESLEDNNTIGWNKNSGPNCSISYSTDNGGTWTDLTLSGNTNFATINTGDKILFKGINNYLSTAWDKYNKFTSTKQFNVYGNIMSLLFGDNFVNNSEFISETNHNFAGLFRDVTKLIDASNLILPALTCAINCYNGMFRGCTGLTTAPQLPATQSAFSCYSSMFEGCINLEIAPEINLVNLSEECCQRMFCMNRNSKITTPKMTKSPILRVTNTALNCYKEMFKGNGNLTEITCLKTDTTGACTNWVVNISTTGTFYKASQKNDWPRNDDGIPSGWTVIDYTES